MIDNVALSYIKMLNCKNRQSDFVFMKLASAGDLVLANNKSADQTAQRSLVSTFVFCFLATSLVH